MRKISSKILPVFYVFCIAVLVVSGYNFYKIKVEQKNRLLTIEKKLNVEEIGESIQLQLNNPKEEVTYIVENDSIVRVSENGKLEAKLETLDAEYTIFELPYIYYPGYKVTLDGRIQDYFETENGFIGIVMVANDNATLEVEYVGTQLMGVSLFISCITLIGMFGYGIKNRLKKPVTLEK